MELNQRSLDYLKSPPDKKTLQRLLKMLSMSARDLMRKKEKEHRELGLDDPGLSEERLMEAMVEHPKLMERSVVVSGKKAALSRPPKHALDAL